MISGSSSCSRLQGSLHDGFSRLEYADGLEHAFRRAPEHVFVAVDVFEFRSWRERLFEHVSLFDRVVDAEDGLEDADFFRLLSPDGGAFLNRDDHDVFCFLRRTGIP